MVCCIVRDSWGKKSWYDFRGESSGMTCGERIETTFAIGFKTVALISNLIPFWLICYFDSRSIVVLCLR